PFIRKDMVFACEKCCIKKRSCGRHKCGELCCEMVSVNILSPYQNCGLHRCQDLCHRGNCQPCWQTSFDELACYCGETVLFPPIPCGTKIQDSRFKIFYLPPEYKNVCTRSHDCDHPGTTQRSNIPCHLQDISCGLAGDKLLPCGSHRCKKICHRGECQAEGECKQPCIHPRPSCGHPCAAPCHPGTPCPPSICSAKVALQCDCGRKKETLPCADAASSYQRNAKQSFINLFIWLFSHRLECDQECATLERNRWLAEALQTDKSVDTFNTSTSSKYSDSLKEDARWFKF
uniref:NF-X1-type domain-containing protein n=1 Tax=Cyprinus carpio TaxID=7962 RepID=A0A8C1GDX2_CYPCA